jgi:hypothetical protein
MRQHYTITVLDLQADAILAKHTAAGLVLPLVAAKPQLRMTTAVREALARTGVDAFISSIGIGQANPERQSIDWHVMAYRRDVPSRTCTQFTWIPVREAASSFCVIPFQAVALRRALDREINEAHRGWGSPEWLREIEAWIRESLAIPSSKAVGPLMQFTATSSRTVFRVDTEVGPVFFKAVRRSPFTEAQLTQRLASWCPGAFPHTIRFCRSHLRWLTNHVGGRTIKLAPARDVVLRVLTAMCRIQADTKDLVSMLEEDGAQVWTGPFLRTSCMRLLNAWRRSSAGGRVAQRSSELFEERLEPALKELEGVPLPMTWVHCDLAPGNIFMDAEGHTAFVDLDRSGIGKPVVGLADVLNLVPPAEHDALIDVITEAWRTKPTDAHRIQLLVRSLEPYVRAALQWQSLSSRLSGGELLEPVAPLVDLAMRRAFAALRN